MLIGTLAGAALSALAKPRRTSEPGGGVRVVPPEATEDEVQHEESESDTKIEK
jgi:hypothetical protein